MHNKRYDFGGVVSHYLPESENETQLLQNLLLFRVKNAEGTNQANSEKTMNERERERLIHLHALLR